MSTDPEYLRNRAKAAEIAGDTDTAKALNDEADAAELAADSPVEGAAP